MPGILGFITRNPNTEDSEAQLLAMLHSMVHEPFYVYGTYALPEFGVYLAWVGHPDQFVNWNPVVDASGDRILLFSGEHLGPATDGRQAAGEFLRTDPQQRAPFLTRLNGWFAGVSVDRRDGSVALFNDRYALHRLYVHSSADSFVFASEAKALLCVRPETRRLDPQGLGEFFALGTALQDRTLFSGVSAMPGGSLWTLERGSVTPRKERYFDASTWEQQPVLPPEEFYNRFHATVATLLPRYFQPAEHVGVSLTGGLDTRMMMAGRPASTRSAASYTYGGIYRDCFDIQVAREISAACGEPHHTLRLDPDFFRDFSSFASETAWLTDGCLDLTGTHEVYFSRKARQLAQIRMTGNYGSEILRSVSTFKYLPPPLSLLDGEVVGSVERAAASFAEVRAAHPVTFAAFKQIPWQLFGRLMAAQSQLTVRSPYTDNALVALMYQAPAELRTHKDTSLRLIADLNPRLAAIRTDMGDGGDGAAPVRFLRKLHRYVLFKAEWYYGGGMPHWLTRFDHNPVARRLESTFVGSHKIEHYRLWFRDQLHGYVSDLLSDVHTASRPYFNRAEVGRLLDAHRKRSGNHLNEISKIISLELIQRSLLSASYTHAQPRPANRMAEAPIARPSLETIR